MKLKKLLSMALAVVMALSILTACRVKIITNTETITVEIVSSAVDEAENIVIAAKDLTKGTLRQYNLLPLDDDTEVHKAFAEKLLNSTEETTDFGTVYDYIFFGILEEADYAGIYEILMYGVYGDQQDDDPAAWIGENGKESKVLKGGKTYMTVVRSGGYNKTNAQLGSDLGEAIVKRARTDDLILIDSVSVFKVTLGGVESDLDLTGSQYEGEIYYIIVVTMAENTKNTNVGSST